MNISEHFKNTSSNKLEDGHKNRKSFILLFHTASFKSFITCLIICLNAFVAKAQTEADFKKTLHDRSVKIVNTLEITDSGKYNNIVDVVAHQYFNLNKIHDKTKESIAAIKSLQLSDEEKINLTKKEEGKKATQLSELHKGFIAKLQKTLTDEQIEKIKDGMTYRVMPITYTAYTDMIPALTAEQKEKIYNWLKEARELAMDEGSSEDKHKVFGKYKGRINNYLSSQGYNMKAEEKAWQQRIKDREAANNKNAS
jgi:Spy/CpxP family protein refolding chaperone